MQEDAAPSLPANPDQEEDEEMEQENQMGHMEQDEEEPDEPSTMKEDSSDYNKGEQQAEGKTKKQKILTSNTRSANPQIGRASCRERV